MNIKELSTELNKINLRIVWSSCGKRVCVGSPRFANPLLWINVYEEDYQGNVRVKSINIQLFTEKQIKKALMLVDEFMQTPVRDRGLMIETI
jgi:hypothetical protein